jgi:hypothetical protein
MKGVATLKNILRRFLSVGAIYWMCDIQLSLSLCDDILQFNVSKATRRRMQFPAAYLLIITVKYFTEHNRLIPFLIHFNAHCHLAASLALENLAANVAYLCLSHTVA